MNFTVFFFLFILIPQSFCGPYTEKDYLRLIATAKRVADLKRRISLSSNATSPAATPTAATSPAATSTAATSTSNQVLCGTSNKLIDKKIIGGNVANPKDWPWMASIMNAEKDHMCGGSLITDRHILTAAHCFDKYAKDDVIVRLGEHDLTNNNEDNPIDFKVNDVRKHEKYNSITISNDIAILKLDRPVIFNELIHPVCLPHHTNHDLEGQFGYAIGWGTQYYGGPATTILQEVGLIVWPLKKCIFQWGIEIVVDSNMCIGHLHEKEKGDTCGGDSGGPFLVQKADFRWYVAGIVSHGSKCGLENFGSVYTRVNMYMDWIEENIL